MPHRPVNIDICSIVAAMVENMIQADATERLYCSVD